MKYNSTLFEELFIQWYQVITCYYKYNAINVPHMYCTICYPCTVHVMYMCFTCGVHVMYMCKIPLTPNSFNPFLYSFTSHIRNMAPSIEKWAWQHFNDIHERYPPAELTEKVSMCSKRTRWTLIPNSRRIIS